MRGRRGGRGAGFLPLTQPGENLARNNPSSVKHSLQKVVEINLSSHHWGWSQTEQSTEDLGGLTLTGRRESGLKARWVEGGALNTTPCGVCPVAPKCVSAGAKGYEGTLNNSPALASPRTVKWTRGSACLKVLASPVRGNPAARCVGPAGRGTAPLCGWVDGGAVSETPHSSPMHLLASILGSPLVLDSAD